MYARSISLLAEDTRATSQRVDASAAHFRAHPRTRMQENLPPGSFRRRLFERAVDIGWKRFADGMEARAARPLRKPYSLRSFVSNKISGAIAASAVRHHFLERLLWPLFKLLVANKLKRRLGGRLRLIVIKRCGVHARKSAACSWSLGCQSSRVTA